MKVRSMKKITALSVLSFLASQMSTTAITITQGMGAIEDFNERKTLRVFAKKPRYKDVELIKIDFTDDGGKNSQKTPRGPVVTFSNQETVQIVNNIKRRKAEKQASDECFESKRKKGQWDYRSVYPFDITKTLSQENLVIDFGQINDQENFFTLRSFFSSLSEKGRLKEEVRFMDNESNRVIITPNKIERLFGESAEKFDAGDNGKIVGKIWEKLEDIDSDSAVIQLENISTPEDTHIVRLVFDKFKGMEQLEGEVHLSTANSRIIITQNRIKIDSPRSEISMLEMGGIDYLDYIDGILAILPQTNPVSQLESLDKPLDEPSLQLPYAVLQVASAHDSDDKKAEDPSSRHLSDDDEQK